MRTLGGSLRCPGNKIAALVGMGSNPTGVLITNDSFCQHKKEKAPGTEKFQKCESNEERAALTVVTKGMHDTSNIFLTAPWLVQALSNAGTIEPCSLILIILEAAKLYDEEYKRCEEDYKKARDHAVAVTNFLWLISYGKITPLKFAVQPDDEELQKYFSSRIKECLKVPMVPADHAPVDTSSCQNGILK